MTTSFSMRHKCTRSPTIDELIHLIKASSDDVYILLGNFKEIPGSDVFMTPPPELYSIRRRRVLLHRPASSIKHLRSEDLLIATTKQGGRSLPAPRLQSFEEMSTMFERRFETFTGIAMLKPQPNPPSEIRLSNLKLESTDDPKYYGRIPAFYFRQLVKATKAAPISLYCHLYSECDTPLHHTRGCMSILHSSLDYPKDSLPQLSDVGILEVIANTPLLDFAIMDRRTPYTRRYPNKDGRSEVINAGDIPINLLPLDRLLIVRELYDEVYLRLREMLSQGYAFSNGCSSIIASPKFANDTMVEPRDQELQELVYEFYPGLERLVNEASFFCGLIVYLTRKRMPSVDERILRHLADMGYKLRHER
ncbi:hypothetical protein BJ508DRAFT_103437 [Ascobolus immersus RN42]|uniref:Uncharacterized protein n=1 Tax=Ascobolus immersus RN42 TaxID=1160509 RepID=A0A3N4HNL5_ASCIM|nr:hypothetical protein BJ508DRAFT_103437 [Ascobolus immersus RN42]